MEYGSVTNTQIHNVCFQIEVSYFVISYFLLKVIYLFLFLFFQIFVIGLTLIVDYHLTLWYIVVFTGGYLSNSLSFCSDIYICKHTYILTQMYICCGSLSCSNIHFHTTTCLSKIRYPRKPFLFPLCALC